VKIPFTKMHGLGNDFVLVDCRDEAVSRQLAAIGDVSKRLCHRRFGIGADQLLLLYPSDTADFSMRIFNADGSEVEMCGNGIRCFAKYVWDRGLSDKPALSIETMAGIIRPQKAGEMVRVDMGEPVLIPEKIPVRIVQSSKFEVQDPESRTPNPVIDFPLKIGDREFKITCVSMGNPHAVIFVDELDGFDVEGYGSVIERHELFPKRTNVEFVRVVDRKRIRMRVWERGSGETMACGTGASASAVAAVLKGLTERELTVTLTGGDLMIQWNEADNHVYMTGPAVEVFEGRVDLRGK